MSDFKFDDDVVYCLLSFCLGVFVGWFFSRDTEVKAPGNQVRHQRWKARDEPSTSEDYEEEDELLAGTTKKERRQRLMH